MSYLKRFVQWVCSWLPWTEDNGTLLKEEDGRITATGVDDNNHSAYQLFCPSKEDIYNENALKFSEEFYFQRFALRVLG